MFWNGFIVAIRNLSKSKWYSLLNISGLAIGLASSLLLILYIYHEWMYDKQYKDVDRVFIAMRNFTPEAGTTMTMNISPTPLAAALAEETPEIEIVARKSNQQTSLITNGDLGLKATGFFVDSSFLDLFGLKMKTSSTDKLLYEPNNIVISTTLAKKLFKDADPLNQVIKYDGENPVKVVGVFEPMPGNSFISRAEYFIPWRLAEQKYNWLRGNNWGNFNIQTYVKLKQHTDYQQINKKIKSIIPRHSNSAGESSEATMFYPMAEYHLYNEFKDGIPVGGRIDMIKMFVILALGILVIACINFMNLSTARSEKRAKEVGIRKAIGASRGSLARQFLTESLIVSFISVLVAVLLVLLCLPKFNELLRLKLALPFTETSTWVFLIGLILFTGILSGSYPALYLSSFKPMVVLKHKLKTSKSQLSLRQVLVIVQFTFAVGLIICSIIIYKQVSYIRNLPIGYDKQNLVEIDIEGKAWDKIDHIKEQILQSRAAESVCVISNTISNENSSCWGVEWPGMRKDQSTLVFHQIACTYDFVTTFGMQLIQGRDFSRSFSTDSTAIILNEEAVKVMGLKDPVGTIVKWQDVDRTVVGVIKNFTLGSPYEQQKPLIIGFEAEWASTYGIRLAGNKSAHESLATIEKIMKSVNPNYPFTYSFVDEQFQRKFQTETLLGNLANIFGGLAIFISCLGLLGLAAFAAEQRTKEIGVRKVLGASVNSIVLLLSGNFIKLVIISNVIGWAISYWAMSNWLKQFTYQTSIQVWVFILAGCISVLIAFITVSALAIRAAWMNPVKSLKSE
ncbi:putative permease [Chitinophaga skermanii]|uniref:Putative permease n=1 Tax=Chitinophaga skermanii TaxID=331697 RepID=A0A327QIX6_9BACT|nr:ABC transporter permease [Chitinophaga skermanii]RAJ03928.1 putative permease [Chitinophaga skermanii]